MNAHKLWRHTAVLVAMLAGTAHAGRPDPGALTPERLKLPSGPNSVRGLADEPTIDPFSAQVGYQVPIDLPGGLGGLAPSLALKYAGVLGNGPLGIGWTFEQPRIQRSTRLGVPHFDDSDQLEIFGGVTGRLVAIGNGEYRLEGAGQSVRVKTAAGGGFELDDGKGNHYRFGTSAASRQESDAAHTLTWLVETETNPMGEQIAYSYLHDQGQVYLTDIAWGPNSVYHATLGYEARTDPARSHRGGFWVVTAQRLATITATAFGVERRAYHLAYDATFPLARLAGVTSTGRAGDGAWPALAFTYAQPAAPVVTPIDGIGTWRLNSNGGTLADLDGDGAVDFLQLATGGHTYRLNQNGTFGASLNLTGNTQPLANLQLQDLDGDARPELVADSGAGWSVWKFSKTRWVLQASVWPGSAGLTLKDPTTTRFADLNGDGLIDGIQWNNDGLSVRLATPTGFTTARAVGKIGGTALPTTAGRFQDVNGDGIDDYVVVNTDRLDVFYGHGDGTFDPVTAVAYPFTGAIATAEDLELADLNRDGLLDLLKVDHGTVRWFPGLATGVFSTAAVTLANPEPLSNTVVVAIADSNGNGSQDVVWSSTGGMWRMDMAGATTAGMLVEVTNGLGLDVTLAYQSSHALAVAALKAGSAWSSLVPIAIPVPVATTTALGPGETTRQVAYGVRDGFWDAAEQQFGGFLTTIVTTSGATPAQTSTVTTRHASGTGIDREMRGRPLVETVSDGTGKVLAQTTSTWSTMAVTGLPDVALLHVAVLREKQVQYPDSSPVRKTDVVYTFDGFGRATHIVDSGRLDVTGDESVRDVTYADDDTTWVRDRVCEDKLSSAAGVVVTDTQYLFGDASPTKLPLCTVGVGWPRETRSWLASEARFVTQAETAYDLHGNPISQIENGVERRLVYDANGLFPLEEHVTAPAQELVWRATWDQVLGEISTLTDPNGHVVHTSYDSLGRYTATSVDDQPPFKVAEYDWTPPFPKTTVWQFDGAPADLAARPATWSAASHWRLTVEVANGKGDARYQALRLSDTQWIVSGYQERDPNARVVFAGRPVLSTQLELSARPDGVSGDTLVYDPLGRLIEQDLPTGAKRTSSYVAFERTTQDADLAPVHSVLDGKGRAILTERSLADGTHESVQASYDPAGRLTQMSLAGGTVLRTFTYDTLGRLVQSQDPDLGSRTITWDDGSRMRSETNAAGQAIHYTYDALGRVITIDNGAVYHYHYDTARPGAGGTLTNLLGQPSWMEEPTGSVDLSYDELGRTSFTRHQIDDRISESTTRYAASGLVLGTSFDDGFSLDYHYDPAGRLVGLGDLWSLLDQDASGTALHERAQNGVDTQYERDVLNLPSRVTVRNAAGAAVYDVQATRNLATEITAIADLDGVGLDHHATFGYDGFSRLVNATVGTADQAFSFGYGYDVLHNMTSRTATGPRTLGELAGAYRYGEGGHAPRQLTSIADGAGAVLHSFNYDAAGRQTAKDQQTMTYDASDRLVRVDGLAGGAVTHAYGQDGARVKTVEPDGSVLYYFGDGVAERNGVREHDVSTGSRVVARVAMPAASASVTAALSTTTKIGLALFGMFAVLLSLILRAPGAWRRARAAGMVGLILVPACAAPGGMSARTQALATPTVTFMHTGFSAGPAIFTDASGNVAEERRYEPFGTPIDARKHGHGADVVGAPDFAAQDLNSLNKRTDVATGWSDHGARWMAPETARWLTPDPAIVGPDPKLMIAPWALHPYQYVEQNPTAYWDPDGRNPAVGTLAPDPGSAIDWGAIGTWAVGVAAAAPEALVVGLFGGGAALDIERIRNSDFSHGCTEDGGACWDEHGTLNARSHQFTISLKDRLEAIKRTAEARADAQTANRPEKTRRLYRGVNVDSPAYPLAQRGIAIPRGGHDSPDEHNGGNTDSIFTSWTTNWNVAESAALDSHFGNGQGVVLTARIPVSRIVKSVDVKEEDEVLVTGPVTDAKVTYVGSAEEAEE